MMSYKPNVLPERLKKARQSANLTQSELANLAGINRVSVYAYEKGRQTPGAVALAGIAVALNVTVDWLLGKDYTVE